MRKPSFVIEGEKVKLLLSKLKPIEDWSKVEQGTLIFHENDNNISNNNTFLGIEDDLVNYRVFNASERKIREYLMSKSGWYYYDESIADEIEESFIPKLWWSHKYGYECDIWFTVCCDEEELWKRYLEEFNEEITIEEFKENYKYGIISDVDGYSIVCE